MREGAPPPDPPPEDPSWDEDESREESLSSEDPPPGPRSPYEPPPPQEPAFSWIQSTILRVTAYVATTTVLLQVAAFIGLALYVYWQVGSEQFNDVLEKAITDNSGEMLIAAHLFAAPAVWLWTWIFRRRLDRRGFRSLGFAREGALRRVAIGAAIGTLLPGLYFVVGWMRGYYEVTEVRSIGEFPFHGMAGLLFFAVGFLVQGTTEELMLRGYIQRNLAEWRPGSFLWILVLPSALFALGHVTNPEFGAVPLINTFLIGMLLGTVVWLEGSIWMATGLHVGWNFALGCLWSLPVSGLQTPGLMDIVTKPDPTLDLLLGGAYGPEGGFLESLVSLVALSMLLPRLERGDAGNR